ncbi:MAG: type II toxin-antitoxin system RelE/ParE family toxin [Planctomycetota bacterium]
MASKIKWSPRSVTNLEDICDYIARDSEFYAALFAKRVMALVESTAHFPRVGRVVPEYGNQNIRERIHGNYRIVYRVKKNMIEIAAICHGAKGLPDI